MQILNNFGISCNWPKTEWIKEEKNVFAKLWSHLNYTTGIRAFEMQTIIFKSFMQTHNIFYVKIFRSTDLIIHSEQKGMTR